MNHNLDLFSSNIKSLLTIYQNSEEIRNVKTNELEKNITNWSDEEFEDFTFYNDHFKWLLLQSLFISGFAYFERFMNLTAISVEKKQNKIKVSDIKGKGYVDTYRKYIHLIGGIEFASSDKKEWQTINEFKLIRNSLTHENGRINKKINKVKEHKIYLGNSENIIRITNVKFLEDFCDSSIAYMTKIVEELNK